MQLDGDALSEFSLNAEMVAMSYTRNMRSSRVLGTLLVWGALLSALDAIPHPGAPARSVAVSFDDLPSSSMFVRICVLVRI